MIFSEPVDLMLLGFLIGILICAIIRKD